MKAYKGTSGHISTSKWSTRDSEVDAEWAVFDRYGYVLSVHGDNKVSAMISARIAANLSTSGSDEYANPIALIEAGSMNTINEAVRARLSN